MEKYGRRGIPYMEERYALLIDAENVRKTKKKESVNAKVNA